MVEDVIGGAGADTAPVDAPDNVSTVEQLTVMSAPTGLLAVVGWICRWRKSNVAPHLEAHEASVLTARLA
jgi:hypothetical protein